MASTETMGTIEQFPAGTESLADMSLGSSTFSILKGDDSVLGLGLPAGTPTSQMTKTLSSGTSNSLTGASTGSGVKYGTSESSLSFGDLAASKGGTPGSNNASGARRSSVTNLAGVKEEGADTNIDPIPTRLDPSLGGSLRVSALGDAMGSSSLSMLKGMVMSTDDVLEAANEEYRSQEQAQQQFQQQQQSPQNQALP